MPGQNGGGRMNADKILERLDEIQERLECLEVEAERLRKAVDENDPEAEVMICVCSVIEEVIRRANGKAYDEISDTKRFLNNVRRSA